MISIYERVSFKYNKIYLQGLSACTIAEVHPPPHNLHRNEIGITLRMKNLVIALTYEKDNLTSADV